MAMPFALAVTVVMSALVAAIFTYSVSNQKSAERARADQKAHGLAEAGLSYAFSTLLNIGPPYLYAPLLGGSGQTVSLTGGTARYWGTLSGTTWTLYGEGTVANPSGPGSNPVVRTVSVQAAITTATTADMRPWDYLFVDQPSGCITMGNSVTMDVSLYIRGNLCLENNAQINSPAVHLIGNLSVNNSAQIGSVADPIDEFEATGTCSYSGVPLTCGPLTHVYADSIGLTPPVLTKPTIDLAGWYSNTENAVGYLGPAQNCTTGSFPGGFDNDSTLNVSLGDVDLTPSTAYDCQRVVNGETVAQIKWEPGSPGTLTIKGVIYFDGDLTWSNLNLITYDGKGVIYASGEIVIRNRADLCGVAACDSTWDPRVDLIVLIAGSLVSQTLTDPTSGEIGNHVNFQGAIYTVTDYVMDNNTTVWGPVITRSASIANSSLIHAPPYPIEWMEGLPGDETTTVEVAKVEGSYAG
jgi:predicted acyltransferase (DUF342 family)